MQYTNCPRCNMFLAPGAQMCPNCQLNLVQYSYQQQQPMHHHVPVQNPVESKKEKQYRILLTVMICVVIGQFLIYKLAGKLYDWSGIEVYSWLRPFNWLNTLAWGAFPLVFALLLPKANKVRVLFIVLASIYGLWQVGGTFYEEFFNSDPFSFFRF